ncbi:hypothetical protein [Nonomuraea recticatena]|uniref:hypothetical protein n=1 Tax=Nonomuraea recticatena TaxID=46178 RepID=UPI0036121339
MRFDRDLLLAAVVAAGQVGTEILLSLDWPRSTTRCCSAARWCSPSDGASPSSCWP